MSIVKASYIDFKFDTGMWARTIANWADVVGVDFISEAIEADPGTIRAWMRASFKSSYPYPSMTLFMRACNLLDLDPRQFFVMDE